MSVVLLWGRYYLFTLIVISDTIHYACSEVVYLICDLNRLILDKLGVVEGKIDMSPTTVD